MPIGLRLLRLLCRRPPVSTATFDARFGSSRSATVYPASDAVQALDRFATHALDRQLLDARAALVRGMGNPDPGSGDLSAGDFRPALVEGTTVAMPAPGVPLPRPRPTAANQPASLVPTLAQIDPGPQR